MNKETKKAPKYNAEILTAMVEKFGFSSYYIRQSINGSKTGITPDRLKAEYFKLENDLTRRINLFKNQ